jgi:Uma2 family endonuclease
MTKRITLEEFFEVDQDKPYPELIAGVVLRKPLSGTWAHSAVQTYLALTLGEFGRQTGLGHALLELHCVFGEPGREHVLCPDLAFVAREYAGRSPRRLRGYHDGAPDLAVEVAMDEDSASRMAFKVQLYLAHGTRAVWIPDPDERALYVMRGGRELARLMPGDRLEDADLLPGFSVAVEDVFAEIDG